MGNINHSPSNLDPNNYRGQESKQIFNDLQSRLLQRRVDTAIELPIDMKPGDLATLNELISPLVALPSEEAIANHNFSMHPIPFACTYICEQYLNKWATETPAAQIGGNMFAERRNQENHQTCMMMDGREDYRVKKAMLSSEDFAARMNNYLHNSCCVLGAQGCRRKEERLACNNVLFWLNISGLFELFHNKSVQMMMAAMIFPLGLSEGKDSYDSRNGINFSVNGKNALMSFINDDSLPYLQDLESWQEYLRAGVKDGHRYKKNFNLIFEHTKKIGNMHIVLITKTSRKVTIHRHLQERTDCIVIYNWIPLMGDLSKKLGITWFNFGALNTKKIMKMLENCKKFYVPRAIAGEIDAFLFNRKDDTIDRQSAGVMLGSKLYRIIIGTQVIQQGYSMCLQDFCDLAILFLLRSFIARTRATGVVGFASNNIMKRGQLMDFFSSIFELIFVPGLDKEGRLANAVRFKRFAREVMKTSMTHELLRQIILKAEKPMNEVYKEFAAEHHIQDIYVPPVKEVTYNPNTRDENLPGQCFNMVVAKVGSSSSLEPFSTQAECEAEVERLRLEHKGITFVDGHAILQTNSGEFCKHFTHKSVHYEDKKGIVYDLTERCDRKWMDSTEKHNVCKTTRALKILEAKKQEITNLCAMPANDEVVWQEYKGKVHHHLDSRYFQNRIIPDYPKKQKLYMDTNIFCPECLRDVNTDYIFADLGGDLPKEHLAMFYCCAMKNLRSTTASKICLKIMDFRHIMESGLNKNFLEELFTYWHVLEPPELQANEVYVVNFRHEKAVIFDKKWAEPEEEWDEPFENGYEEGDDYDIPYKSKPAHKSKKTTLEKNILEFLKRNGREKRENRENWDALPKLDIHEQSWNWLPYNTTHPKPRPSAPPLTPPESPRRNLEEVDEEVVMAMRGETEEEDEDLEDLVRRFNALRNPQVQVQDHLEEAINTPLPEDDEETFDDSGLVDYESDGESKPADMFAVAAQLVKLRTANWEENQRVAAEKQAKKEKRLRKKVSFEEWKRREAAKEAAAAEALAQSTEGATAVVEAGATAIIEETKQEQPKPLPKAVTEVQSVVEHTQANSPLPSGNNTPNVDWAASTEETEVNPRYPHLKDCLQYPEFWATPFDGTVSSLDACQDVMSKKLGGVFEQECTLTRPPKLMTVDDASGDYFAREDVAHLLAAHGRDLLKTKKQYISSPPHLIYSQIPFWGYVDRIDGDKIVGAVQEAPEVKFSKTKIDFTTLKKHQPAVTLAKDLGDTREEKYKELHRQARLTVSNWQVKSTVIEIELMEGTYGSGKSYYLRKHVQESGWNMERGEENYIIVCPTGALAKEYRDLKFKAMTWSVALASFDHFDRIDAIYIDEIFLMDPRVVYYFCDQGARVFAVGDRRQMRPDIPVAKLFDIGEKMDKVPRLNVTRSTPVDCVAILNKQEPEKTLTMSKVYNSIRLRKVKKLDDAEGCKKDCRIEHDHMPLFVFDKHRSHFHGIPTIASIQGLRKPVVSLMMTPTAKMLIEKVQGQFLVACSRHTKRINVFYTDVTERMVRTYLGEIKSKQMPIGAQDKVPTIREPKGPSGKGFNRIGSRDDYTTVHGDSEFLEVRYVEGEGKLFSTNYEGKLGRDKRMNLEKIIEQADGELEVKYPRNYEVNAARSGKQPLNVDLVECDPLEFQRPSDPLGDEREEVKQTERLFTSHQTYPADASNIVMKAAPNSSSVGESRRSVNITTHRRLKEGKILTLKSAEALSHHENRVTMVQMAHLFATTQTNSTNHRLATAVERYGQHQKRELSTAEHAQKLYDLQQGFMKFVEIENLRPPTAEEHEICRAQSLLRAAAKKNQKETDEWGAMWSTTEQIKCFNKEQLKCKVGEESWLNAKSVETLDRDNLVYIKGGQMVSAQPKEVNQVASPHVNWAERIVMASTKGNVLFGYGHSPRTLKKKIQRILRDQDQYYEACSTDISEQDTTKDEVTDDFMRWIYNMCGVPDNVIDVMEKPNRHWVMNNLSCKVRVRYQFQSGRADTLFANTCHLMGVIGSSFDIENLRLAMFQGDDCYLRADHLHKRADAFENLKVDNHLVGDFVGFLVGHESLYLDVVRIAAKTLSRVIGDDGRREELRQAVNDTLALNKTLKEKQDNVYFSAAKHKLSTGDVNLLYDYLEAYSSCNEDDVDTYRIGKNMKERCTHIVQQVMVTQTF